jgi:hypothetical protein
VAWQEAGYGRLRYAVSTESFVRRFRGVHERLGIPPDLPSVPDGQVALAVRLTEAERRGKRAALAAQASQTESLAAAMGEQTYRHWYAAETFRAPTAADLAAAEAAVAEVGS